MKELNVLIDKYRGLVSRCKDGNEAIDAILDGLASDLSGGVMGVDPDGCILHLKLQDPINPFDRREGEMLDMVLAQQLGDLKEDMVNISMDAVAVRTMPRSSLKGYSLSVFLIKALGERYGSLIVFGRITELTHDQVSLCAYVATLIGFIAREKHNREAFERRRKLEEVRSVCDILSYSELMAAASIFRLIAGGEGLIVASRIAQKEGITRSVIVNAVRKLEGAGIIESRSLGMKGTYIKVLNEYFVQEMNKIKK